MTSSALMRVAKASQTNFFLAHALSKLGLARQASFLNTRGHNAICEYLEHNLGEYLSTCEMGVQPPSRCKQPFSGPIWLMWWQGEASAPRSVRLSIASIKSAFPDSDVHVIDKNNYTSFCTIPPLFIDLLEAERFGLAHFSDIVRVSLLREHGGLWMDATLYAPRAFIPPMGADGFVTRRSVPGRTARFASGQRWSVYLLGGPADLPVWDYLFGFFQAYWDNNDHLINYFLTDYALLIAYRKNLLGFAESVNSVPASSPNIHFLASKLDANPRTSLEYLLPSDTDLFKLTWRIGQRERPDDVLSRLERQLRFAR